MAQSREHMARMSTHIRMLLTALGSLASFAPSEEPYRAPLSDAEALRADAESTGRDLRSAMRQVDEQKEPPA
jgi:hypothetical protein